MRNPPKGFRCHIGLFGRRNVGKSSLLNAMTRQQVSIVSDFAGTTTDPIEKPMELLPLGPVLFVDTAGIDDVSELGQLRVERTRQVFNRTDIGIIVTDAGDWSQYEEEILGELQRREVPVVVVLNKADKSELRDATIQRLSQEEIRLVRTIATDGVGILDLRQALLESAPDDFINNPRIVSDLVGPGEYAVLVVPIDKEAPKGRLILPQQQAIRDLLDADSYCVVVKERELRSALRCLRRPPRLVVTDSQVFLKVAADTPRDIPMTSFSVLYARFKGDLLEQVCGTLAVERLKSGDRLLIAEACSHHPIGDDIGRVKIPRWLQQFVGGHLTVDVVQGHDFPEDLSRYSLVVHCGACMWNRREMLSRILRCREQGVAISNYGLMIAYCLGVFERALEPFPEVLEVYRRARTRLWQTQRVGASFLSSSDMQ